MLKNLHKYYNFNIYFVCGNIKVSIFKSVPDPKTEPIYSDKQSKKDLS
jgi:hypothetical protein